MFKMGKQATYWWPVKVKVPVSGGKHETQNFDVLFKRLPQSKITGMIEQTAEGGSDNAFALEAVVDWKGIQDEAGIDVPFSHTALSELLDVPMVAKAVVLAYLESIAGAPIKN